MSNADQRPEDTVTFTVEPGGTLNGPVFVPGDKSMSHRAIMFGSIAEGVTEVSGFLNGEDCLRTRAAFEAMGVRTEDSSDGDVIIHGQGSSALTPAKAAIDLGNSGTGMRLLAGLLAGIGVPATLTGDSSLSVRPMRRITDPLSAMGAKIATEPGGTPPIQIAGGHALTGMDYVCPMASAQVKSAVLLAGLHAKGTTRVTEPGVTRDHTERMLNGFGVEVVSKDLVASIEGGQTLKATKVDVPADISSSAFFLVGAAMTPGSNVVLKNVGVNPTRTGVIDILRLMGASIELENPRESGGEPIADLVVKGSQLQGISVPESLVSLAIDEFPALFVAAACATGTTVVTGAEELRVKETDRIAVMADGLKILGVDITPTEDGAKIVGGTLQGGVVDSVGDHRTAMAFSMAALRAEGTITIKDCANVNTSFPDYVGIASKAGLKVSAARGVAPGATQGAAQ